MLMGELSHGATIGLGSDVRLDAGEMIPFFGHDMPTNTVPARLALRFDCELVPARAERLPGGRYRITLYPPVRPDDRQRRARGAGARHDDEAERISSKSGSAQRRASGCVLRAAGRKKSNAPRNRRRRQTARTS